MPKNFTAEQLPKAVQSLLNRHLSAASVPVRSSPLTSEPLSAAEELPQPSEAPAELALSGKIITATCFTPYTFSYRRKSETEQDADDSTRDNAWELTPRRGSAALYDSMKHLAAKSSGWEHTVVAWTGEIMEISPDELTHPDQHMQNPRTAQKGLHMNLPAMNAQLLNKAKVPPPIPIVGGTADRMSMKGDYSKPPTEVKPKVGHNEREQLQKVLDEKAPEAGWQKIKPVWLGDEDDGGLPLGDADMGRWRQYAERVLWPTFHYIIPQTFSPDEGAMLEERGWWRDYIRFNNAFADAIIEVYKPGDIIWIHDYHLLILPEILRQRLGRDVYIGLFVHAPWPSSEIFKILSRRKQLLEGMLSANMVSFQSETYKSHFVSCCRRILGYAEKYDEKGNVTGVDTYGAHCAVHVNPVGMDVQKVRAAVTDPGVEENMQKIRGAYGDVKIIVGRDRLDGVRGVLQKLRAYERFLENHPEWVEKVVLIQITSPSHLMDSSSLQSQVSELVSEINGRFGSLHYTPVQHYPQYLKPQEYYALLRAADLGLITSVRDGMNTASIEYIICQKDTHGHVILSEFTGTAESIPHAIVVNPTNTAQVADKIARCLNFTPEERDEHFRKLWDYVSTNTSQTWNARFLRKLFVELKRDKAHPITPVVDSVRLLNSYNAAKSRLFMFDYDGTLTPIVQDPQMAIPADRVVRTLKRLAQDPANSVWIISGRDTKFLSQWLGHIDELGLSAEHGCFIREPKTTVWKNLAETMDMGWQAVAERVFRTYTEKTPGSFIEMKDIAVTWHYRRADMQLGKFMAEECKKTMLEAVKDWDVEVMEGKANIEIRPKALNKGEIVRRLLQQYGNSPPDLVFCAGDDRTDEDMFEVLGEVKAAEIQEPGRQEGDKDGMVEGGDEGVKKKKLGDVFAVTVGPRSKVTKAGWHLLEPSDVVNSVGACVGIVDPRDVGVSRGVEGEKAEKKG